MQLRLYISFTSYMVSNELIGKFGSRGKGFYRYEEVIKLLQKEGFEIMETEYVPKKLGSFIYETWLYLCYRAGLLLFYRFYFPLLTPSHILRSSIVRSRREMK